MLRTSLMGLCLSLAATAGFAAQCITERGRFPTYVRGLAQEARSVGIGQRGLTALSQTSLSGITWRFESRPSSQTGTLQSDPAAFLAKRSGSSASAFINLVKNRIARNPKTFAAIESRYGVQAEVLATIWGLETSFGGYLGGTPLVSGAVTLASYCRRHPRFESHALAMLDMVDRGVVSPSTKGGPSGELGHMQFLAGNWLRYGVDADGDGKADPYDPVDALASAANMLRSNGWRPGQSFENGSANFGVLAVWNDSGNYQRAIAYAATQAAR